MVSDNLGSIESNENGTVESFDETSTNILMSTPRCAIPVLKNSCKIHTLWWNAERDRTVLAGKIRYLKMKRLFSIGDVIKEALVKLTFKREGNLLAS